MAGMLLRDLGADVVRVCFRRAPVTPEDCMDRGKRFTQADEGELARLGARPTSC